MLPIRPDKIGTAEVREKNMTKRFVLATLAATGMISGMAAAVTPAVTSTTPQIVVVTPNHASVSNNNVIAVKNRVWPPAAMITVEPCAVAECRDA